MTLISARLAPRQSAKASGREQAARSTCSARTITSYFASRSHPASWRKARLAARCPCSARTHRRTTDSGAAPHGPGTSRAPWLAAMRRRRHSAPLNGAVRHRRQAARRGVVSRARTSGCQCDPTHKGAAPPPARSPGSPQRPCLLHWGVVARGGPGPSTDPSQERCAAPPPGRLGTAMALAAPTATVGLRG
jgi:hypothetical protein